MRRTFSEAFYRRKHAGGRYRRMVRIADQRQLLIGSFGIFLLVYGGVIVRAL
ncbi:MAG: hypothetical protein JO166_04085 [Deltaproteobacteria bacterium]|nr:hypothetical protein [Deltaproteobacteria bacterium]